MDKKIVAYILLESEFASKVQDMVNDNLANGWVLYGEPQCALDKNGFGPSCTYIQAMVKYE